MLHHVPGTCACRNRAPMGLFIYGALRNSHICEIARDRLRAPLLFVYVLHCLCDVQKIIIIIWHSRGDRWIVDQTDTCRGHKNLQKTPQRVSKFCSCPEVVSTIQRLENYCIVGAWEALEHQIFSYKGSSYKQMVCVRENRHRERE